MAALGSTRLHMMLEAARGAALAGGALLRERSGDVGRVRSKSSAIDLVSDVDVAAGVAVVRTLLHSDPAARVIVEEPEVCKELGVEPGTLEDPLVWVIDPLDGTTSYIHGYPCYSVAVALIEEGRPVAGVVYNAALDELVSAAVGYGATRNGARLTCTDAPGIRNALLITGFPYDRGAPLDRQLAVLSAFLRAPVHGIRRDGSAAVDCCHVAEGRADGFWEFGLKVWDMAAGVVICREAGATVSDADGRPWTPKTDSICVAGPRVHAEMLEVIAGVAA